MSTPYVYGACRAYVALSGMFLASFFFFLVIFRFDA